MEPYLTTAVLILHVLLNALWFGSHLGTAARLRRGHVAGGAALTGAVEDARRMRGPAIVGAVGTFASGIGLIFLRYGGFKGLPIGFHVALGLAMIGVLVELAVVGPAIKAVREGAPGRGAVKRVAAGTGVIHLIWLVSLSLMFIKAA